MDSNEELCSTGYSVSLAWLLLQAYGLSMSILTIMGVLPIKYDIQIITMLVAFCTILGYWGLAALSRVFYYNASEIQKKYWATLGLSEITSVPFSLWGVDGFMVWSLIAMPASFLLASYAFLGFMKLQISLKGSGGNGAINNIRNILIGFFVIALLVAWNVWYENIWLE